MKKVLYILRHYWFQLLVAWMLAYLLVRRVDYAELRQVFVEVSWFFVFLAVLANFASIMLKVTSWKIIFDFSFRDFHGRWIDLTSALMIGFLFNALIPARVGEFARAHVIARRQEIRGAAISRSTVFGTIILERVFDGIVLALIIVYGVVHMDLPDWADKGALVILVLIAALAGALVLLESKREQIQESAEAARTRTEEYHPWWKKQLTRLHGIVARFSEGQQVLRSPVRVVAIFFTTTASWLSQLTAVYFSLHAFHLAAIGWLGALLLLILINIAGALPATPGNVGVFQLATVIPLRVAYGQAFPDLITPAHALAFSIGLQVIEGSIGLGIGSAFLLREGLSFKQVRRESLREISSS